MIQPELDLPQSFFTYLTYTDVRALCHRLDYAMLGHAFSVRRSFKERAAKFSKAQQVAEAERLAKKLQDKTQELEALRDEQELFEEASEFRQKLAQAELDLNSKTADLHFAQCQIDTTTTALKNIQGPLEEKRQQCIAANQQHRKHSKKVCHSGPADCDVCRRIL